MLNSKLSTDLAVFRIFGQHTLGAINTLVTLRKWWTKSYIE